MRVTIKLDLPLRQQLDHVFKSCLFLAQHDMVAAGRYRKKIYSLISEVFCVMLDTLRLPHGAGKMTYNVTTGILLVEDGTPSYTITQEADDGS